MGWGVVGEGHLRAEVDVLCEGAVGEGVLEVVRVHTGAVWDHMQIMCPCHGNHTTSLGRIRNHHVCKEAMCCPLPRDPTHMHPLTSVTPPIH